MTKKKKMPISFQKYNLKRLLKKYGIDEDLIDLDALIDPNLTYQENKAIVMEHIKKLKNNIDDDILNEDKYKKEYIDHLMNIARDIHESRPENARERDEKLKAKNVIDLENSKNPDKDFEKWVKNPGRFDILGIDFIPDFSKPLKKVLRG